MNTFYMIGIKGSGMSALAHILHDAGYTVIGSDTEKFVFTEPPLVDKGIEILPFDKDNLKEEYIVIAGNSFSDEQEEIVAARELDLEFYRYHEYIGVFMQDYISVGISGTSGKTTTTALMSHIFTPQVATSYLIGDGTGVFNEESKYFMLEACEYKNHFHSYTQKYGIITNINLDHPDAFTSIDDTVVSFQKFANNCNVVIACGDNENTRRISGDPIYYYGILDNNDIQAINIDRQPEGTYFDINFLGKIIEGFYLTLVGDHMLQNALSCITVALLEDLDVLEIKEALRSFDGAKRRFDIYEHNNQILIDDYAHHYKEVEVTLEAAKTKYPGKEIVAVFEPLTFTRLEAYLTDFADVLKLADTVYLCPIFGSARESKGGNITISDLQKEIPESLLIDFDSLHQLSDHEDSVLIFMGAGVYRYLNAYMNE